MNAGDDVGKEGPNYVQIAAVIWEEGKEGAACGVGRSPLRETL